MRAHPTVSTRLSFTCVCGTEYFRHPSYFSDMCIVCKVYADQQADYEAALEVEKQATQEKK